MNRLCINKAEQPPKISQKAMDILLNHNYPGNVRELENILEHAFILSNSGIIEPDDLPEYLNSSTEYLNSSTDHTKVQQSTYSPASSDYPNSNQQKFLSDMFGQDEDFFERERLIQTLRIHNWHRGNTASALGIERTTLWRKMKKYGLSAH